MQDGDCRGVSGWYAGKAQSTNVKMQLMSRTQTSARLSQLVQKPTAYLEALIHVLHDLDRVVAIGQDIQQVC